MWNSTQRPRRRRPGSGRALEQRGESGVAPRELPQVPHDVQAAVAMALELLDVLEAAEGLELGGALRIGADQTHAHHHARWWTLRRTEARRGLERDLGLGVADDLVARLLGHRVDH